MQDFFKDKTILITGGASGIGKIMCRRVLELGVSHLIIWDINEKGLQQVQQDLGKFNRKISIFPVDISELSEIKIAGEKTLSITPYVDVLINNAGVLVGNFFHMRSHEDINKSMNINSLALMHITKIFLPGMMERNSGAICNISSSASLVANPQMSLYVASKWAVTGFSESLRIEMNQLKKNISVTTIMPYYFQTDLMKGIQSKIIHIKKPEEVAERILKAISQRKKIVAFPMPFWFIRLNQALLPLSVYDWVMDKVFGIYTQMKTFEGKELSDQKLKNS